MQTVRRFLVLTPVAFVVTTVAYLIYFTAVGAGSFGSAVDSALRAALMGAVIVLVAVLIAVGLLHLLRVSNAWVALGLAFGLVVVALGISYASIGNDDGWGMLGLIAVAGAQIPGWLTFAVGLLVGDLRNRAARNAVSPAA